MAARQGRKAGGLCVLVQSVTNAADEERMRFGLTATKKLGNAVIRNRARRRMREAARTLLPQHGEPGHDYVLIAREGIIASPWPALLDDVKAALIRLKRAK